MNKIQKILLAIYLPMTLLILIIDNIYPKEDMVLYLKYSTMITLFLSAIKMKKKFREQKVMTLSLFFLVVADFFLVFINTIDNFNIDLSFVGVVGFLFAYLCLIVAYQKNFGVGKGEITTAILIVIGFICIIISLQPYVKGLMFVGILIFGLVLCYMTWTSICTIFRNYFKPKLARLIAISGVLMFICDIGVAFSRFHPLYLKGYMPWLPYIIWGTYIPGWTILAIIISEKNLLVVNV